MENFLVGLHRQPVSGLSASAALNFPHVCHFPKEASAGTAGVFLANLIGNILSLLEQGLFGGGVTKVQDVNRLSHVIAVFAKYGFVEFIASLHLSSYHSFIDSLLPTEERHKIESSSRWKRLCWALEECGPTYVKFGQLMANRSDLLPLDLLNELRTLQDQVPPFPAEQAIAVIQTELGGRIETLFSHFEKEPIAAASIAQVHRAALPSGEKCAVKIQRPNIEEGVQADLEIMHYMSELLYRHYEWAREFGIVNMVDEFEVALTKEMDFTIEASHIQRFSENFKGEPKIYVPKVFGSHTTEKVLTMELIEATELKDILEGKYRGFDKKKIASTLSDLYLRQLFEFGFFHGDPHPGNLFILPDNVVCFLDFGMMGILTDKQRENLGNLCLGISDRNAHLILKSIQRMTPSSNLTSNEKIEFEVEELLDRYTYMPLKNVNLGAFIGELIKIIMRFDVKLPPNIFVLMKGLITIEGVILALDPEYDLIAKVQPCAKFIMMQRFKPEALAKGAFETLLDLSTIAKELPQTLAEFVEQLKGGKLKVDFEHHGLEDSQQTMDRVSNRIAFSIVIASLIIGSSLLIHSKTEPTVGEISIVGIIGFVGAGVMGLWWIWSILRHGRL